VRGETGLAVHHERRFVKALVQAVARFLGRIGMWLASRTPNRLAVLKSRGGLRIAEKGKGAKYSDQKWAGNKIIQSKNWKNCLNGVKFEKY
jgi:hypothetical protein